MKAVARTLASPRQRSRLPGLAAVIALSEDGAELLAAGYLGHGLWDAVHHRRGLDTSMPWWYVPLCLSYDTAVAAYILLRFA